MDEAIDQGAIYAPILFRCPDQKTCYLQDLIYQWHRQSPHTAALTCEHPMVCLQIERFPDLHHKNEILIDFPRIEVLFPILAIARGQQVQWTQFRIATLTLHLGPIPDTGHYQGFLLTNGDIWMTDDDRLPWKSRLNEELKQNCYLFWLASQQRLAQFWRRPLFHPRSTDEWIELLANAFNQP